MEIQITPESIRMIYDDSLDKIAQSYNSKIERLTHIEYNNERKEWEIMTPDFKKITSHKSRTLLLKAEVNVCNAVGIRPLQLNDKELIVNEITKLEQEA